MRKKIKAYTENKTSRFHVGQTIRVMGSDGPFNDVVRWCFWQEVKLAPYGEDLLYPALVLTNRSWCAESDVIGE